MPTESEKRTEIVDGRAHKSYGHLKPMEAWDVFIRDHHQGYIGWTEYEQNQTMLAGNAYGQASGEAKSGRGGQALLSSLICCGRCGRHLKTAYVSGGGRSRSIARPVYRCDLPNLQAGRRMGIPGGTISC